jgi:hypothetical protein
MPRGNRGIVLLEVLVALAVLATAGLSIAGLVSTGLRSEVDAVARERALRSEEQVLTGLTLLPRAELDRRLGRERAGAVVATIERPELTLYRIAIADTIAPEIEALVTIVYKPEPAHGP